MTFSLKQTALILVLVMAALVCVNGCNPLSTLPEDEKDRGCISFDYLFPHKWWDYYKIALESAEEGEWEKAEEYLKAAIRQRDGDTWRARTYGRHFIDYFPHRELGIVYYYQAKKYQKSGEKDAEKLAESCMEEAERELFELSLKQTPSAKALFYLELAYQNLPKNEKPSPVITICDCEKLQNGEVKELPNPLPVKNNPAMICGKVSDKGKYIKSLYIKSEEFSEPLFLLNGKDDLERAEEVCFEKKLFLSHGTHPITIEAESITGKVGKKEVKVQVNTVDRVAIIDKQILDDGKIAISGALKNEAGVSGVFVNGESIPVKQGKEVYFNKTITADFDKSIKLTAYDGLKNKIYTKYLHSKQQKDILLASVTSIGNILIKF